MKRQLSVRVLYLSRICITDNLIRHQRDGFFEIKFQIATFGAADNLLTAFVAGQCLIVCTYMEVSKCSVNALLGRLQNLYSLKRTSVTLHSLDRDNIVQELVVVWILKSVLLAGFFDVRCLTSLLDRLTICSFIFGIEDI